MCPRVVGGRETCGWTDGQTDGRTAPHGAVRYYPRCLRLQLLPRYRCSPVASAVIESSCSRTDIAVPVLRRRTRLLRSAAPIISPERPSSPHSTPHRSARRRHTDRRRACRDERRDGRVNPARRTQHAICKRRRRRTRRPPTTRRYHELGEQRAIRHRSSERPPASPCARRPTRRSSADPSTARPSSHRSFSQPPARLPARPPARLPASAPTRQPYAHFCACVKPIRYPGEIVIITVVISGEFAL